MQLAAEALLIKFRKHNINILSILVSLNDEANVIRRYTVKDSNKIDELVILILLYMDNRAILFNSRSDVEKGTPIYIDFIAKFSLIAYTRSKVKN